ncbi:MAG: hypothetical protein OHK0046_36190 [Anaerolineae bacterium]
MAYKSLSVLIIDDEREWYDIIGFILKNLGHKTEHASNFEEAQMKLEEAQQSGEMYDVATIDDNFKIGISTSTQTNLTLGRQILQYIKSSYPQVGCVMISESEKITLETVLDLRDEYDLDYYITKGRIYETDLLTHALQYAVRRAQPYRERPTVFVSYRRSTSWGHARAITTSLRQHKIQVFLDFDSINQGRFDQIISKAIQERQFFVPLLNERAFDSEWVVKEIGLAVALKKPIIPLFMDNFDIGAATLPPAIDELKLQNGITINSEFYEDAITRLVKRFLEHE